MSTASSNGLLEIYQHLEGAGGSDNGFNCHQSQHRLELPPLDAIKVDISSR